MGSCIFSGQALSPACQVIRLPESMTCRWGRDVACMIPSRQKFSIRAGKQIVCAGPLIERTQNPVFHFARQLRARSEALGLFDRLRDDRGIAFSLEGLAGAWAARGRPERAARIRAAADRLRHATGLLLPDLDRKMYDHYIRAVEVMLGETAFRAASLDGVTMPLPDLIREALSEN